MNILVIGLGSMGKRRVRLIKEMYTNYTIYGVDGRRDRREEANRLFGICCFETISEAGGKNIDAAFVCTSPLSHNEIIEECLNNKWDVFTELNLVADGYEENMSLATKNECTLFLSSTFFYREEIKYMKKKIESEHKKYNYVYHIGQYLPDWHPWETYNDFFVGNKRTNGCREIMAIELPWLVDTFGNIKNICVQADKMTELNIDYNDNYMIQIQHESGSKGVLIVDVVLPVAVRRLEIYSENMYLQWGGTPDTLYEFDKIDGQLKNVVLTEKEEHVEGYRAFVVENAYKNEIREFFEVMEKNKIAQYGFEQDLKILKLINTIEA